MTEQEVVRFRRRVRLDYWDKYADKLLNDEERWHTYITQFLPYELDRARARNQLPSDTREWLVLLVGFSLEPLLQAVCAWKPQHVLLIVNTAYGQYEDKAWSTFVRGRLLELHKSRPLLLPVEPTIDITTLEGDQPKDTFRCLREHVLTLLKTHDRHQIVLDITGGKKSMVAGTYLFGAYADVQISYVDFDDDAYEPRYGKPYGDACNIGLLENPYTIFGLHEWQRVEGLYKHYAFRNARELVQRLIPQMDGFFRDDDIKAAERLVQVLEMHELWDNGDYTGAFTVYSHIVRWLPATSSVQLPTAIQALGEGGYWPQGNDAKTLIEQIEVLEYGDSNHPSLCIPSLYIDVGRLLVYVHDELAKVARLIDQNEDARSALLRAAGLTEVLLRARLLILLHTENVQIVVKPEQGIILTDEDWTTVSQEVKNWSKAIRERIIDQPSVYPFINALQYRPDGNAKARKPTILTCRQGDEPQQEREFLIRRTTEAPLLSDDVLLGQETRLRNKATHT